MSVFPKPPAGSGNPFRKTKQQSIQQSAEWLSDSPRVNHYFQVAAYAIPKAVACSTTFEVQLHSRRELH